MGCDLNHLDTRVYVITEAVPLTVHMLIRLHTGFSAWGGRETICVVWDLGHSSPRDLASLFIPL